MATLLTLSSTGEDFSTKTTTNEKMVCQFEMGCFKKPFCWRSNLSK